MKKFNVYGVMQSSYLIGTYEAESKEEAEQMAEDDPEAKEQPMLCHYCSTDIDLGETDKIISYEVD